MYIYGLTQKNLILLVLQLELESEVKFNFLWYIILKVKGILMHTIQLQLDDNLYEEIAQSGIDIKEKFKEFLTDFIDDGYPTITTQEAKRRVSEAVEEYRDGTMKTVSHKEVWSSINEYTKSKSENQI